MHAIKMHAIKVNVSFGIRGEYVLLGIFEVWGISNSVADKEIRHPHRGAGFLDSILPADAHTPQ